MSLSKSTATPGIAAVSGEKGGWPRCGLLGRQHSAQAGPYGEGQEYLPLEGPGDLPPGHTCVGSAKLKQQSP